MKHLIETELGKRAEGRPVRRGLVSAKSRRPPGAKSGVTPFRKVSTKRSRRVSKAKTARIAKLTVVPPAPEIPAPVLLPATESIIGRGSYDGNTAFNLYLREVAETPLLTLKDEVELAARIKRGDKAARERMIKANLRLVVKIARDYENYGVPLLDLVSEGNIGLMKAVERFDPAKGAKLSTYAAWWIKQAIKRALANQSKTIRLPVHVVDKLFHLRRMTVKLQELLGREPSDQELADELGTTVERILELRRSAVSPAPLDANLGNDEDSNRLADVVADENAENPLNELEEKTNGDMVRNLVQTLNPREATILRYRFGLDGDDEKTLEEVGEKFGVTRERIRQIQEIALRKLRNRIKRLDRGKLTAS
jgi:RNA polymerase primary sigma factor